MVWTPNTIYVYELKDDGTAEEALKQMDGHRYAIPYETDGRNVVKVRVKFNVETRIPESWSI